MHTTKVPLGLTPKLYSKYDGPFYIAAEGSNHTYKLRRRSNNKLLKSYINANRLKHYHDPAHRRNLDLPLETVTDNDDFPDNVNNNSQSASDNTQLSQDPEISQNPQDLLNVPTQINSEQSQANSPPSSQSKYKSNDPSVDTWYDVERLLRMKKINGVTHFLVKWVGYPYRDSTWEPECNLPPLLVRNFLIYKTQRGTRRKHPNNVLLKKNE